MLTKQKGEESGGITEGYCYIGRFHMNLVYSCHMTRFVFRIIIQVNAQHHYCGDQITLLSLILKSSITVDHQLLESISKHHMIYIHTFDIFGSDLICLFV